MRRFLPLLFFFLFTACGNGDTSPDHKIATFASNVMTINYKIMVSYDDEKDISTIESIIEDSFEEINAIYNNWNPNSELSKINSLPANVKVTLSHKLRKFLQLSATLVEVSQGLFDPTIAPLHTLWKSALEKGHEPSREEIAATAVATGWEKIHIEGNTFYKDNNASTIDLCGIAKGIAVDLIVERLNGHGFHNTYVEWGGEIRCSGHHPSKRPWRIFISRLGDPDPLHAIATVNLSDNAIATSGDYWQYWTTNDGSTYSHIVNPITNKALRVTDDSIASVNVLAPTCALADALATAAMLFPTKEAFQQWKEEVSAKIPGIRFWITTRKDLSSNKEKAS